MQETNRNTLADALKRLPDHTPPDFLWETLENRLNSEFVTRNALPRLPEYHAPEAIWQKLEKQLDAKKKTGAITHSLNWSIAAAATGVLMVLVVLFFRPDRGSEETIQVAVSLEVFDEHLQEVVREPEDEAFAIIDQLCQGRLSVCEQPEFKSLRSELDELTNAKAELRKAMGNYSTDPELHAQLARIERERSEVLRQMMNLI